MGADDADGHAHGPRASAKRPPAVPCDGAPGVHFSGKPIQPYMPGSGRPAVQQAPASYAIAGKVMFAAAGAFAAVLLALIALHLYSSGRRRRARDSRRRGLRLHRSLAIFGDEEAPPSPPRGLDPAVLRALPVVAAAVGAGDCAVCLAELERGEEARALPRCGHRFHVECIDAWFRENSTCPLCRADVEAPLDDAEVRIDVVGDDGDATTAKCGAPAMRRASSGMDLDKARRVFASTRSASF